MSRLNIHQSGVPVLFGCYMDGADQKMLPSRRTFREHHTTMHQFLLDGQAKLVCTSECPL